MREVADLLAPWKKQWGPVLHILPVQHPLLGALLLYLQLHHARFLYCLYASRWRLHKLWDVRGAAEWDLLRYLKRRLLLTDLHWGLRHAHAFQHESRHLAPF